MTHQKAMRETSLESLRGQVKVQNDDWSFSQLTYGNTQYLTHFFHHWTAKFIPQIPQNIIRQFGQPGGVVVDPFMGCGTTLVEAKLLGCPSYGLDINPLAVKIARAKVSHIDEKKVEELLSWLNDQKCSQATGQLSLFDDSKNTSATPNLFEGSEKWFRSDVAKKIYQILEYISNFDETTKNFVEIGLSDLLKGMSNSRLDRTVPTLPKTSQYFDRKHKSPIDNETREINVFHRVVSQLSRMLQALHQFHSLTGNIPCEPILGDARYLSQYVSHADLVITSPPYWNAQNYQKLHFLSFKLLRLPEPGETEIGRKESQYLSDMQQVISEVAKILKGYFVVVIGENKTQEHEKLRVMALEQGMRQVEVYTRQILNHTFFAKAVKKEHIYVFEI